MDAQMLIREARVNFDAGRIRRAIQILEGVLAKNPDSLEVRAALIMCYGLVDRMTDLITLLRETTETFPSAVSFTSSYLFCLNYFPVTPVFILNEHLRTMRRVEKHILRSPRPRAPKLPGSKIRIGYLSGDFRTHACAHLTLPLLKLNDREKFEIFLYSNNPNDDPRTETFKSLGTWRDIRHLPDEDAAAIMEQDAIDILVDLSGHTAHGRVGLLMRRPAPVQVSWYGYLNTLGTKAVDYRITDPFLAPDGIDLLYTEKLLRIPRSFLYEPDADAPPVAPAPFKKNGYFTFGAIHNSKKISNRTLDLWCRVLQAVPSSRIVVNVEMGGDLEQSLHTRFSMRGIAPERITFEKDRALPHYYDFFGEFDLGLDSFPYTSGVSAMHGIWMGAPTLTIEGTTELGRNCAAVNRSRGLNELVTTSEAEFVARAVEFASNPERLERFRATCRLQPVVDNASVVRALEERYASLVP